VDNGFSFYASTVIHSSLYEISS